MPPWQLKLVPSPTILCDEFTGLRLDGRGSSAAGAMFVLAANRYRSGLPLRADLLAATMLFGLGPSADVTCKRKGRHRIFGDGHQAVVVGFNVAR